jgi:DNA polymerase V
MSTLGQFTPELEIYSINEAFLNLAGISVDYLEYAQEIQRKTMITDLFKTLANSSIIKI